MRGSRPRLTGVGRYMESAPLIFPALGSLYQTLAPWAEALLRAVVGLALVPAWAAQHVRAVAEHRRALAQS